MPTLDWIGKDKVINHHKDVPYKVLERKYSFDESGMHKEDIHSNNMIIHGDNLEALKSLLPQYEGKIKCIYIDPPYNTGNEGWIYNDNVNDPKIRKWLGEVVGKEGEDLSRHDKWLCMMYPRLVLLQKLLADDGAIFISIDDNEVYNLKLICDEIFSQSNFLGDVIWQHSVQSNGYGGKFVSQFNHTIVYSKTNEFVLKNLPRTEKDNKLYKNPDNDPRGKWRAGYCVNGLYRPNLKYDIITPNGNIIESPEKGWRWSKETLEKKIQEGEIIYNADETAIIHKLYLNDLDGKVPENIWTKGDTPNRVVVTVYGKVLDPNYTRLLHANDDLDLRTVFLLDQVQKKKTISKEDFSQLKSRNLVEGRYPNIFVSYKVAKVVGDKANYVRQKGLDEEVCMHFILSTLKLGPAKKSDLLAVLKDVLPDVLTDQQKSRKLSNLLQKMKKNGIIDVRGIAINSEWYLLTKD